MTNSKSTKRALLTSSISLILCFAMLLGTTFAWFTDSASTGVNKIQSGNLDINVYYATSADVVDGKIPDDSWEEVKKDTQVFNPDALWEPGYTEVVYFKIENAGSLALKYIMSANIASETAGINKDGDEFNLSDYLSAYYMTGDDATVFTARDKAQSLDGWASMVPELAPATLAEAVSMETGKAKALSYENALESGEVAYTTMAIFMPTTVGDEANYKTSEDDKDPLKYAPSIDLGINFVATQYTSEVDSYGSDYDEKAEYLPIADEYAATAEEMVKALEEAEIGDTIALLNDIKIDPANMSNAYGKTGINIKKGQTLDGNGNTLDIKGAGGTWDSGISTTGDKIKNLTVTGSFRGIFVNHNSDHSERVILDNVIIDGTTYTISCDQGTGKGLTATRSTFNGWTSYAATIGNVEFTNCNFGKGNGYAYCRPYAPTAFVGCEFEAGFTVDPRAAVTFENCTVGGVKLTAENLATLVTNTVNATVK